RRVEGLVPCGCLRGAVRVVIGRYLLEGQRFIPFAVVFPVHGSDQVIAGLDIRGNSGEREEKNAAKGKYFHNNSCNGEQRYYGLGGGKVSGTEEGADDGIRHRRPVGLDKR